MIAKEEASAHLEPYAVIRIGLVVKNMFSHEQGPILFTDAKS